MFKFVYCFGILYAISLVLVSVQCLPVQENVDQSLPEKMVPEPGRIVRSASPLFSLHGGLLKLHHHRRPHYHHGGGYEEGGYGGYGSNNGGFSGASASAFSGNGGSHFGGGSQSNAQSFSSNFNTPFGSFSASQAVSSSSSNGGGSFGFKK